MQVFHEILTQPLELGRPAVTMGTFDGLHLGHIQIIEKLKAVAKAEQRAAVAVTFDPHPQRVLAAEDRAPKLLTTLEERVGLFEKAGIEHVVVIPFNREFSRWTADRFINEILAGNLAAGHLVVGYDHAFGHDRRGKTDMLAAELEKLDIPLDVVAPVKIADGPVKSSRIRRLLAAGDLKTANELLGYEYSFSGEVIRGDGRGARLGFPTANLKVPRAKQLPPHGIYGAWARVAEATYPALMHLGPRPTVGQDAVSVEVHLLDFPGRELYGEQIRVTPEVGLREVEAFRDTGELVRQMEKDKIQYIEYMNRKENTRAS